LKNKGLGDFQGVTSEINVTGRNSDKSFNNNDGTAGTGEIGVSEDKGKGNGNNFLAHRVLPYILICPLEALKSLLRAFNG